jgi:hypothetical protein
MATRLYRLYRISRTRTSFELIFLWVRQTRSGNANLSA